MWLCWVFVAVCGLPLVAASQGHFLVVWGWWLSRDSRTGPNPPHTSAGCPLGGGGKVTKPSATTFSNLNLKVGPESGKGYWKSELLQKPRTCGIILLPSSWSPDKTWAGFTIKMKVEDPLCHLGKDFPGTRNEQVDPLYPTPCDQSRGAGSPT